MAAGKDVDLAPVGRKRRSWKRDEKRQIVEESLQDGASIAEVARRHDLNANLLFTWRRQLGLESIETNDLTRILPVTITAEAMQERGLESSGQMEIILSGGERILVWTDVETAALSRVLKEPPYHSSMIPGTSANSWAIPDNLERRWQASA